MTDQAVPAAIPGERIDPLPKSQDKALHAIEDRSHAAGTGFRRSHGSPRRRPRCLPPAPRTTCSCRCSR